MACVARISKCPPSAQPQRTFVCGTTPPALATDTQFSFTAAKSHSGGLPPAPAARLQPVIVVVVAVGQ